MDLSEKLIKARENIAGEKEKQTNKIKKKNKKTKLRYFVRRRNT